MMNAVIDVGNTNVKIGLFKDNGALTISLISSEDVIPCLQKNKVEKVLVCNVALKNQLLVEIRKINVEIDEFTINTPMPISTLYGTPTTLGIDRLASCVGARNYADGNVLVIDAGSCITYDVLNKNSVHVGGVISPGVAMRLKAMHTFTANLPLVAMEHTPLLGDSTQNCLQSGASNGSLAEMKGLIEQFRREYENLSIIIGGGDAVFFDKNLKLNTFVVSNLAVEGLHTIFKYNE